jgi:gas vesicle protein GvpN
MHANEEIWPEASPRFVLTPQLEDLVDRALGYLTAGYPINLAGPAGTGKTTLAMHLAARLRRPVTLIHGDDEFGSSDLVGSDQGYRKSKLVDNFIHSVVRTEETMKTLWADNRLTTACRCGHVLIYDEFTRSRPEANNVLLSVLGERLLTLPQPPNGEDGYLEVHPGFRAIFTSNPQEYAGVHRSQDALLDRLITIHMDHYDPQTEAAIAAAAGGVGAEMAEQIVRLVHHFRQRDPTGQHPSMRVAIMLCRVLACRGLSCDPSHPLVLAICQDVLHLGGPSNRAAGRRAAAAAGSPSAAVDLEQVLDEVWGAARAAEPPSEGPHGGPAGQRACPAHASPEWDEVLV